MNKCSSVQGTLILESTFRYFGNPLTCEDSDLALTLIHWYLSLHLHQYGFSYGSFLNTEPFGHILLFYQAILEKLSVSYFPAWGKINQTNRSLWFLLFLLITYVYILNLRNVRDFFFNSCNFFCHVANRKKTTFWEWPYGQRMKNY